MDLAKPVSPSVPTEATEGASQSESTTPCAGDNVPLLSKVGSEENRYRIWINPLSAWETKIDRGNYSLIANTAI